MFYDSTLERLYPDQLKGDEVTGAATLALHIERYEFAATHAMPGRLVDIACGTGYGTRLLKDRRPDLIEVVGVDICEHAIDYARARYQTDGIRFVVHDATTFCEAELFDTVVSLETLEHLPCPETFVEHILTRVLRRGGVLVCSAPVTPSVDVNPYHTHDFSERSFRRLFLSRGLKELACFRQNQHFSPFSMLTRREVRSRELRSDLLKYYLKHPRALIRRLLATLRWGFQNRYCTIVWQAEKQGTF